MGVDYTTLTELLLDCKYIDTVTYFWDEENEKTSKVLYVRARATSNQANYLGYTRMIAQDEMPNMVFSEHHARHVAMEIIEAVKNGLGIK